MLISALLLTLAQPAPSAPDARVACVTTLAIVAYEQQRGTAWARVFPTIGRDGARYAQVVGEAMVREGRSKEQVRDAMLAAASARQRAGGNPTPAEVNACLARAGRDAPPPAPPTLAECAGLLTLATEDLRRRQPGAAAVRDMEVFAAVLDNRARTALREAGRSQSEIDAEVSGVRSRLTGEARAREADGVSAGIELGPCFALAAP